MDIRVNKTEGATPSWERRLTVNQLGEYIVGQGVVGAVDNMMILSSEHPIC